MKLPNGLVCRIPQLINGELSDAIFLFPINGAVVGQGRSIGDPEGFYEQLKPTQVMAVIYKNSGMGCSIKDVCLLTLGSLEDNVTVVQLLIEKKLGEAVDHFMANLS